MKRRTQKQNDMRKLVDGTLASFATERQVPAKNDIWTHITAWQRAGLVTLRWDDGRSDYCNVSLTPKGHALVSKPGAKT